MLFTVDHGDRWTLHLLPPYIASSERVTYILFNEFFWLVKLSRENKNFCCLETVKIQFNNHKHREKKMFFHFMSSSFRYVCNLRHIFLFFSSQSTGQAWRDSSSPWSQWGSKLHTHYFHSITWAQRAILNCITYTQKAILNYFLIMAHKCYRSLYYQQNYN